MIAQARGRGARRGPLDGTPCTRCSPQRRASGLRPGDERPGMCTGSTRTRAALMMVAVDHPRRSRCKRPSRFGADSPAPTDACPRSVGTDTGLARRAAWSRPARAHEDGGCRTQAERQAVGHHLPRRALRGRPADEGQTLLECKPTPAARTRYACTWPIAHPCVGDQIYGANRPAPASGSSANSSKVPPRAGCNPITGKELHSIRHRPILVISPRGYRAVLGRQDWEAGTRFAASLPSRP
jgi:hypothetical protein